MDLRIKYPDRVPVIVKSELLKKHKFLVPMDMNVSQFMHTVRQFIKVENRPQDGYFFIINNTMPTMNDLMLTLYYLHKDENEYLHMELKKESVFGNIIPIQ